MSLTVLLKYVNHLDLLEVASDPSPSLFNQAAAYKEDGGQFRQSVGLLGIDLGTDDNTYGNLLGSYPASIQSTPISYLAKTQPRTTVLTQFQTLSKREWQNLQRDPQLFWMHLAVAIVTGVFVGGMYFQVDITIAGFQVSGRSVPSTGHCRLRETDVMIIYQSH